MTKATLPIPLKDMLEVQHSEVRLQRIWLGVSARRSKEHTRYRAWVGLIAAGVTLLIGIWLWSARGRFANPTASTLGPLPASIVGVSAAYVQDFGLGAVVTVEPGARIDVLSQSPEGLLLALRQGRVEFDIRPGSGRRWQIECGGTTVEVLGTAFVLDRDSHGLRVKVTRGRVLVRGDRVPDSVQTVQAGGELAIATEKPNPAASVAHDSVVGQPAVAGTAVTSSGPTRLASKQAATPDWRALAAEKDWSQAWQLLGADGVTREASRADDVADLLALADVARLTEHPEQATLPLSQIVNQHSADPRAALAAFTLGKLLLDRLGKPAAAAEAFQRAIALKVPSALAEDAAARLVESYAKAGAPLQARDAATSYRSSFPRGHRAAEVERWSPKP